jgi:peptidase M48-like protein
VVALLLGAGVGCHAPRPSLPPSSTTWLDAVDELRLRRLDQATNRLGATELGVTLSRREGFGAWAWPRGPIEVSRNLIDLVDDDELTAVIAHELGHLQDAGHWRGPTASLDGGSYLDVESRADQVGCRILRLGGIDPAATIRLLDKLNVALGSPADPAPFAARIARARAGCTC